MQDTYGGQLALRHTQSPVQPSQRTQLQLLGSKIKAPRLYRQPAVSSIISLIQRDSFSPGIKRVP